MDKKNIQELLWLFNKDNKGADGKTIHLYDEKRKTIVTTIQTSHAREILGDDYKYHLRQNSRLCGFEYLPRSLDRIIPREIKGLYIYNTYTAPVWYKNALDYSQRPCSPPEIITEFIGHLFDKDKDSIEYFLDWAATLLRKRVLPALTLIGPQGTGKNTLAKILELLIGGNNFFKTDDRILKDKFNGGITNNLLVHIDEVHIKQKEHLNRFKDLINDSITVEAKFVDSQSTSNHASFLITSNDWFVGNFGEKQRRLSIPTSTQRPLDTNTEVYSRRDQLFEEENIEQFGRFLLNRNIARDMNKVFVSNSSAEIIKDSMYSEWENNILELHKKQKGEETTYSYIQIKEMFNIGRDKQKEFYEKHPNKFEIKYIDKVLYVNLI